VVRAGGDNVADIGAESEASIGPLPVSPHFNGEKGGVRDIDPELFHRRHENVTAVRLAAKDRCK
jgi:hypothetical protein